MKVIDLPATLDFQTLDALLAEVAGAGGEKVLFDGRHLRWVGPNGMVGLLAAGSVGRDRSGEPPILELSGSGDVKSYLGRMGFFRAAEGIFAPGTPFPRRSPGDFQYVQPMKKHQRPPDGSPRLGNPRSD